MREERSIYPTKDSMEEAVNHIESQLPIHSFNEFYALMIIYDNTRRRIQAAQSKEISS